MFQLEAKYKDICLASFLSELYQTTSMTPEEWPYYAYLYKIALGFFKQEE
ncbi:MAG: hypothetical protein U9Q15_02665 [Patescibacteria group bacterium]|nr:hypothetical protein [Patescibacteria group bacterium]